MTDLNDTTTPYELLLRLHPDGSFAAHVQHRRRVVLNGEVLVDQPLAQHQLEPGHPEHGAAHRDVLARFMTDAQVGLVTRMQALETQLAAAGEAQGALDQLRAAEAKRADTAEGRVRELNQTVTLLAARAGTAEDTVEALRRSVAELSARLDPAGAAP